MHWLVLYVTLSLQLRFREGMTCPRTLARKRKAKFQTHISLTPGLSLVSPKGEMARGKEWWASREGIAIEPKAGSSTVVQVLVSTWVLQEHKGADGALSAG